MTRPVAASLAALALLLTACSARHTIGTAVTGPSPAATSAAGRQTPIARPAASRTTMPARATSFAIPGTTVSASAPSSRPTDLGAIRSALTGAGNAAGVASQHVSSGDAAASQDDTP